MLNHLLLKSKHVEVETEQLAAKGVVVLSLLSCVVLAAAAVPAATTAAATFGGALATAAVAATQQCSAIQCHLTWAAAVTATG